MAGKVKLMKETLTMVYVCEITNLPFLMTLTKVRKSGSLVRMIDKIRSAHKRVSEPKSCESDFALVYFVSRYTHKGC